MKEVGLSVVTVALCIVIVCSAPESFQITSNPKCNQTNEQSISCYSYRSTIVPSTVVNNITSIINLNVIAYETRVPDNNTEINNINVNRNKTSKRTSGPCCSVVRPKSCRKFKHSSKCRYRRDTVCGAKCKSHTMHTKVQRKCRLQNGCGRHTVYIPEPIVPPQCISIYRWPYTLCGLYPQSVNCDGCYDDYEYSGYGSRKCYGCYDDGFKYGPLYRRGPVLRPFYVHVPPCELSGTCYGYVPVTLNEEFYIWDGGDNERLEGMNDYEGSGDWFETPSNYRYKQEIQTETFSRKPSKSEVHNDAHHAARMKSERIAKRHRRPVQLMDPAKSYRIPQTFLPVDTQPDYIKFFHENENLSYAPTSNKYVRKQLYSRNRFPVDEDDLIPIESDKF